MGCQYYIYKIEATLKSLYIVRFLCLQQIAYFSIMSVFLFKTFTHLLNKITHYSTTHRKIHVISNIA